MSDIVFKFPTIMYKGGYKYSLVHSMIVRLPLWPPETIRTGWVTLSQTGQLFIKSGYQWDGPSGPAIDTPNFMRASLVHDVLYQLLRHKHLPDSYRVLADRIMRDICKADGMGFLRRWWTYLGVRWFADSAADPGSKRRVLIAP